MAFSRYQVLTEPIVEYIQMEVARCGKKPVRLESENSLSKRFNISRPCVHEAMEKLIRTGWCIELPGKQGVFSNPERSAPETRVISILYCGCESPFIHWDPKIQAIFGEFTDNRTFLKFERFASRDTEGMKKEVDRWNSDAYLLINNAQLPSHMTPIMQYISEQKETFLAVAYDYIFCPYLPQKDIYYWKHTGEWKYRMEFIRKGHYKHPVWFNGIDEKVQTMQCEAAGNIPEVKNVSELNKLLKEYQADLIIADGGMSYYPDLFKLLKKYKGPQPNVLMYQIGNAFQETDKIHFIQDNEYYREEAKTVVSMLRQKMETFMLKNG